MGKRRRRGEGGGLNRSLRFLAHRLSTLFAVRFSEGLQPDKRVRRDLEQRFPRSPVEPSRAEPSRAEPSRAGPSRAEPSRAEPGRAGPGRAVRGQAGHPERADPWLKLSRLEKNISGRSNPSNPTFFYQIKYRGLHDVDLQY